MAKILFIVTGATYWVLKDGTGTRPGTGPRSSRTLTSAHGCRPRGRRRHPGRRDPERRHDEPSPVHGGRRAGCARPGGRSSGPPRRCGARCKLSDVRLEDYDAVYLPGGHGPMADLAFDADAGRLLTAATRVGQTAVHRVPRALRDAGHQDPRRVALQGLQGHRLHQRRGGGRRAGLPGTWLLENELKEKVSVKFSRGPMWKPYMVEDRNLVTGQNPALRRGPGRPDARDPQVGTPASAGAGRSGGDVPLPRPARARQFREPPSSQCRVTGVAVTSAE